MAKAIEVFEATLLTPGSPFDIFPKGDRLALNAKEQDGLRTFLDKGCVACHGGINIGGADYEDRVSHHAAWFRSNSAAST